MLHTNLFELIQAIGYLGLFAIVFAETGLLLGFFLPGDSLLFTAGILASQGYLDIYLLLVVLAGAAIIGDSVGYSIGRKLGPRIFSKEESLLFNKSHIDKAQKFFEKHGPKTIIIARFVPIVRTFAPTLAGVGKMNYGLFLAYNIVGGLLWTVSITVLGYYLGLKVDNIEKYILPGVVLIVLLSIAPYLKTFLTNKEMRTETYHYIRRMGKRFRSKE
jgi:membrane-associated protein